MKSPVVRLKIRATLPDGSRQYLDPAITPNGKLRAGFALIEGEPHRFASYSYALRYSKGGKRIWEMVGSDPAVALAAKLKAEKWVAAVAAGIKVEVEEVGASQPTHELRPLITQYLDDILTFKERKTYLAYRVSLTQFASCCSKEYVEQVDRRDVLNFMGFLKKQGNVPRTIHNRLVYLRTFFLSQGMKFPIEKSDWPKYTEKVVSCYSQQELRALISHATLDEQDMIYVFLGAGLRDKELQYAAWSDISYSAKTITVTEKLDLGFRPKDKEEGAIPIPDHILNMLAERRRRYPHTRLIFELRGKPQGHFLRVIKRLALKAGLNCGHCRNKAGKSCATHAVCSRVILHKLRKTFASMHHEAGVSARTIQRWLRHSDLNTTLKYLAASDDSSARTRDQVNSTFSGIM